LIDALPATWRVLRISTLICFAVVLLSGGSLLALAIAVPVIQQKLPWRTAPAENFESGGEVATSVLQFSVQGFCFRDTNLQPTNI